MSLANLRIQEARGVLPSLFDDQHTRRRQYGFIDVAARNTPFLLRQVNKEIIEQSWGASATKLPARTNRTGTATLATMNCNIAPQDSIAQYVTLTKIDIKDSFRLYPDMVNQETETSLAEEFAQQSQDTFHNIAQLLDVAIKDAIDTAKATTSNSSFVGAGNKYPFATDTLQVSNADIQFFYNDFKAIYMSDDFSLNGMEIIGDANQMAFVERFINQGGSNNENSQFQFNGIQFSYSNNTTTTLNALSTFYGMPRGSVAVVNRHNPSCVANDGAGRQFGNKMFMTVNNELFPFSLDAQMEMSCQDGSTFIPNGDDTLAYQELWEYGLQVFIVTPFAPETNSGIKKVDFLAV